MLSGQLICQYGSRVKEWGHCSLPYGMSSFFDRLPVHTLEMVYRYLGGCVVYIAARGRRAEIRNMHVASVAGKIAVKLPAPHRRPFLLKEDVWDQRWHYWGVSSAVHFHSAKFTSPACRKELALRTGFDCLRPMYMVTGEAVNSLRR